MASELPNPAIVKNKRKVLRAAITHDTANFVLVDDENLVEGQIMLQKLNRHKHEIAKLDDIMQQSLTDDKEIEADVERAFDYMERLEDGIQRLDCLLKEALLSREKAKEPASTTSKIATVKTPKLEMTKFSGDPLRWEEFWDDFTCSVDSRQDLSIIDKFKILKQALHGEALAVANGYYLTQRNYQEVKDVLVDRFGDPQVAIFAHFVSLLEVKPATHDLDQLIRIRDSCEAHIRSLSALGLSEDTFGLVFAPILLSKLPRFVKMERHRRNGSNKWTLSALREHLKEEIRARTKSDRGFSAKLSEPGASAEDRNVSKTKGREASQAKAGTASALLVQNKSAKQAWGKKSSSYHKNMPVKCVFCEGSHKNWDCERYKTVADRQERLGKRCYKCLSDRHIKGDCTSDKRCFYCGKNNHNSCLCYQKFGSSEKGMVVQALNPKAAEFTPERQLLEKTGNTNQQKQHNGIAIMESALVSVEGQDGVTKARIVFDNGSTVSFVRSSVVKKIGASPALKAATSISRFGDSSSATRMYPLVNITLKLKNGNKLMLKLREIAQISTPIRLVPLPLDGNELQLDDEELAEILVDRPVDADIDILVGLDYYYDIVGPEYHRFSTGIIVKDTEVGKILTGYIRDTGMNQPAKAKHHQMLIMEKPDRRFEVENFWRLENIGITEEPNLADDDTAVAHFNSTVKFLDGRYEVQWPFKTENPDIPDNYDLALTRLSSVNKRLQRNSNLLSAYNQVFQHRRNLGIIEEAPEKPTGVVHYLPHHAVVTPGKLTTKVRVVFDASARSKPQATSLNDAMYRGPVFLNDLVGMILRFRMPPIALVSDIEKAFLQISVSPVHRDCTRFLWLKDTTLPPSPQNLTTFRYTRVPFGMKASPFLLAATIIHHLKLVKTPVAQSILRNTYMDNILGCVRSRTEAEEYYAEAKRLFSAMSMNLREWYSNDNTFLKSISLPDRGTGENPSVLGIKWQPSEDVIWCQFSSKEHLALPVITKRQILSSIAAIFDPCGWFSAITIRGKLIMQELWQEHRDWDVPVKPESHRKFNQLLNDLASIPAMKLKRQITPPDVKTTTPMVELHAFCDASTKAYASCVYIRFPREPGEPGAHCEIVFAKARVAPLKKLSIPRLELLGVLLGKRLLIFVENEIGVPVKGKFVWTDSVCVLAWLQRDRVTSVFVENRLKEIRSARTTRFRYVPTDTNPADLATRGLDLMLLKVSNLWWKGPTWLSQDAIDWPEEPRQLIPSEEHFENVKLLAVDASSLKDDVFQPERYSSLYKLLRVTAYVFRAISVWKINSCRHSLHLGVKEVAQSKLFWEKRIQHKHFQFMFNRTPTKQQQCLVEQLGLFVDEEGLIRCKGRYYAERSLPQSAKNPKLMPYSDRFTTLLIADFHNKVLHSGLKYTLAKTREEYWIIKGRSAVKKTLHECQVCRIHFGGPFRTPEHPPLPDFRVNLRKPFSCVGLDYLGPLLVQPKGRSGKEKCWVVIYTCAVVRAIHLDVVESQSTADFLLCIRRFASLYGMPDIIVSDNASQFKAADATFNKLWKQFQESTEVHEFATRHGFQWKFITEKAPWMGGFYERLISSVKRAMKATLGRRTITLTELQTASFEIAFVLNGRPLVYSEDEPTDQVLTPSHLLFRSRETFPHMPDGETEYLHMLTKADELVSQWKRGQRLLQAFWEQWRNTYLLSLREALKPHSSRAVSDIEARVGTVVLVIDHLPRGMWKVGKITKLKASKDGKVRTVELQLPTKRCLIRPVKLLYPIEGGLLAGD